MPHHRGDEPGIVSRLAFDLVTSDERRPVVENSALILQQSEIDQQLITDSSASGIVIPNPFTSTGRVAATQYS
jgi:hypothetical protein